MRDASPFEIYKIYKGEAADRAINFLNEFIRIVREKGIQAEYPEEGILIELMGERGYVHQYIGFIKADHTAGRARVRINFQRPGLTPETFIASLTPDQEILMEEWRKISLKGGMSQLGNIDLLELRNIVDQYKKPRVRFIRDNPPVIKTIGFSKSLLREAIIEVSKRIRERRNGIQRKARDQPLDPITREYICGNRVKRDITMEPMPKAYYMMLYNELRKQGLLENTTFI